jgi:hypothetical protein
VNGNFWCFSDMTPTLTFLLLSLGWYLCWWTISPQGYHLHSSQWFSAVVSGSALTWFITRVSSAQWSVVQHWHGLLQGYHLPSSQWFSTHVVYYEGIICPVVSGSALTWFITWYHLPSSQWFSTRMVYYEGIICPVVSGSALTWFITRVSSAQ